MCISYCLSSCCVVFLHIYFRGFLKQFPFAVCWWKGSMDAYWHGWSCVEWQETFSNRIWHCYFSGMGFEKWFKCSLKSFKSCSWRVKLSSCNVSASMEFFGLVWFGYNDMNKLFEGKEIVVGEPCFSVFKLFF